MIADLTMPADLPPQARHFATRARGRFALAPIAVGEEREQLGDHTIAGLIEAPSYIAAAKPAAVLMPVIARPSGLSLLLTERAAHLKAHAGQVAFPGGRIEPGETAREAALRESEEEIGLASRHVTPLCYLPPYYSGSGFRVQPVLGLVEPAAAWQPNPSEVARIFEIPLDHALDLARYSHGTTFWRGLERRFFVLNHPEAYIWGLTAGIMRIFAERF